jgi:hypothetical protein
MCHRLNGISKASTLTKIKGIIRDGSNFLLEYYKVGGMKMEFRLRVNLHSIVQLLSQTL